MRPLPLLVFGALLGLLATSAPVAAQPAASGRSSSALPGYSPRAAVLGYLEAMRAGREADAAALLDADPARAAELARRLKLVLDRHAWLDLGAISDDPAGRLDDGLHPEHEEIARIPGPGGTDEPILLERVGDGTEARWVFARATTARIDAWYERLGSRWLLERLHPWFLRPGPYEVLRWQWLAMPVLILIAWLAGAILGRLTRSLLSRLVGRTSTTWDDQVLIRVAGPLTFAWGLAAMYLLLPWLGLYRPAAEAGYRVLKVLVFVDFFWALLRSVDVVVAIVGRTAWAASYPGSRALVPLAARIGKVLLVAIAVVAVLAEFGYPVASLVAGLGIGGIAIALAAQKTVENLFGAFSIGVDQPFREGDFVRIEDFVGTVEAIGLRSTRIRTLDRTIVTLPNGKLADMRLESFAVRDRIRLATTIGLVYGTTAAQLREVLTSLERILRDHPKIWPDAVIVRFSAFGASSLDIEIMAWFQTSDWGEFQLIRQETLLAFMEAVEAAGTSFAFPTRTVHLVTDESAPAPPPARPEARAQG